MQNRLVPRGVGIGLRHCGVRAGNGLFERVGLTDESWKALVELVLAAMAVGVFNNPTSGDSF